MVAGPLEFHPNLPADCPLPGAQPHVGIMYRALKAAEPTEWDFTSDAERAREGYSVEDCLNWGLSVWVSEGGVEHARRIIKGFHKKCVVRVVVGVADGLLLATPTDNQPEHHTYWKGANCQLCAKAEVHIARQAQR